MSDEKFKQVFQVSQPARLVVGNIRGSTEIRAGVDGTIRVEAVKHTGSGDAQRTVIEIKQGDDGTVKVKTDFPEAAFSWLFGSWPCKVDYVITAPRRCALKVNGVSNETLVEGFEGECSVNSVSGDVTLRNLTGDIKVNEVSGNVELGSASGTLNLHTVSGKISAEKVSGSVKLDTVSGDMRLTESSLPSVESESVSGNLQLQTPLGVGPYRFHSISGQLRMTVPAETRCSAELHSISGGISVSMPQSATSRQNGTQLVEVQGGGVKVVMNSVSGGLSLAS